MAKEKYIWLEMTKEWGGFAIGDVIRFGESKGVERAEKGFGKQVPEPPEEKRKRADAAKKAAKDEADAANQLHRQGGREIETADNSPKGETTAAAPTKAKPKAAEKKKK